MNDYTIPKPKLSPVVYLLGGVILIGLAALFIAARFAFTQIGHGAAQSTFAALLIEFGMIVDAIVVMRSANPKKLWPALIGLGISLLVSGTYNYIQAQIGGAQRGITAGWQLTALALGPLSALTFLSLTVGGELRDHEAQVAQWEQERQRWLDDRAAQITADNEAHEARLRQEQEEREARARREQAEQELRIRQVELDAQAKIERMRIRAERKALQTVQEPVKALQAPESGLATTGNARERLVQYYQVNPHASQSEAARVLQVSHTRVGQLLKDLESTGKIRRNGKVEVL